MAKIGVLISMVPDDLQDVILQHADRLEECKLVKEKVITLIDARERLRDTDAMDIGYMRDDWHEEDEAEVGAVGKDGAAVQGFRCGGVGHRAAQCAKPYEKGKGKREKGNKGKGKGASPKGNGNGLQCKRFGKNGHTAANCWTLHPDQLPWKRAAAVEEADGEDEECDIVQLDVLDPHGRDERTRIDADMENASAQK